ncbi:MAG: NAD-dependent epimerase/dehydratase family protein [Bacteroidota bacterium]
MSTRIVITGANGHVGRAVLERLWDGNAETFAIVRTAGALRAGKVLVDSLGSARAFKLIRQADVVIHLAGALHPKPSDTCYGANVATTAAVARAVRGSNVKRIIYLSYLDATERSSNDFLRTKARAERLLLETKIPTVVFRCSHIVGDPQNPGPFASMMLSHDGEPVKILGTGRQIVAPVYLGDVVETILRAVENGLCGTFELSGPDRMTMDDLARLLNSNPEVPIRHLADRLAMFLSNMVPGLPAGLVDIVVKPSVGNPAEAIRQFRLRLHSLGTVWKARVVPLPETTIQSNTAFAELSQ